MHVSFHINKEQTERVDFVLSEPQNAGSGTFRTLDLTKWHSQGCSEITVFLTTGQAHRLARTISEQLESEKYGEVVAI